MACNCACCCAYDDDEAGMTSEEVGRAIGRLTEKLDSTGEPAGVEWGDWQDGPPPWNAEEYQYEKANGGYRHRLPEVNPAPVVRRGTLTVNFPAGETPIISGTCSYLLSHENGPTQVTCNVDIMFDDGVPVLIELI